MRIRKHAKISAMLSSSGHLSPEAALLQTHVCQLNQSPWDVIIFPPDSSSTPPYQVDGDDSLTGNGSFGDSIGAAESVASLIMEEEKRENGGEAILCCKSDGKGWQCKREAKEGHSLCEHHLTQLRNYNSLAHPAASKKSDKSPEKARRPRAKKASSATNPHEFYYYSGFGPLWGKKRSTNKSNDTKLDAPAEPSTIEITTPPPLPLPQIDNDELDYIEDEDEYEEEEKGDAGKKRGRKPIKARSLKSLM